MSLLGSVAGFVILKGLIGLPFYYKQARNLWLVTLFSSMAVAPLITILYHETSVDFWYVYFSMILADIFICYFGVQRNGWKAVVSAFFSNTVAMIFFYILNG